MDALYEDKLMHYRRIEKIIRDFEENEARNNQAMEEIRRKSQSNKKSIGPANDLIRFLYILEQQYQSDDEQTRMKTKEDILRYICQTQNSDDGNEIIEESTEPEESTTEHDDNQQPEQANELTPMKLILHPPPPNPQPSSVIPVPSPIVPSFRSNNEFGDISPETLVAYKSLLSQAQEYEKRYSVVDLARKKQLASYIKALMNRLRKETFDTLTIELFQFLNGQENRSGNQIIRLSNDEERLLCLSMLGKLTFAQLLGGDLNDIKTEIFLPLICKISGHPQHKEFSCIFRDYLHKKCPYTVPYYPELKSTMNTRQYLEAQGYIDKQDGDQRRIETETEFLVRMNGLIRFFCKLLLVRGPPFDVNLAFAWKWFADVLNLPPRSNITSILIRVFLEECGEIMVKVYSTHFIKILNTIRSKYLPRIEKETSSDQMTRLLLKLNELPK